MHLNSVTGKDTAFMMNHFKNIFGVRLKNEEQDKVNGAKDTVYSNRLYKSSELTEFCSWIVAIT